jgi:hypothetical protein
MNVDDLILAMTAAPGTVRLAQNVSIRCPFKFNQVTVANIHNSFRILVYYYYLYYFIGRC